MLNPRSLQRSDLRRLDARHRPRASTQKWVYDQHYGVALARRFYQNKPPTILDAPLNMQWRRGRTCRIRKRRSGARGIGEPPVGAGCGAVMNAIADAVGDEVFRRVAGDADIILTALENGGQRTHEPLTAHI